MRNSKRRRPQRRHRVFWIWTEIIILLFLAIVLGVVGGTFYSVSKLLPAGMDIASYKPTEATKIISYDGVILAQVYEENRETVSIADIPKDLQNATVAVEDSRFYNHLGIDFIGICRALVTNLKSGHMAQGGSTLTQQLARNIYLTREKKLSRKLQEVVLAIELERNFTKEQILELYLNQVYYGSGAYGVQTAAKIYFGKNVKDLDLAECALIAGLPQKPSGYSPYEDTDAAVRRRNTVLGRMARLHYITREQCREAQAESVHLVGLKPSGIQKYKAPWFVTYVIRELTDKYGADLIYRGGLRIYTTLNYGMQEAAENALRGAVSGAKRQNVSQGALICIEPSTGYIKAMVGGANPDFSKDQYNRVTQARRQPGSSFKAFVYTAAIDNGYDANYKLSNAKITYKGYGESGWTPRNYNGKYGGTYTIKQAVAQSINVCAVRMAEKVGIDQVIQYARALGVKSPLSRNLALALGCSGVTPMEMASAYGVFAADGVRAEPMCVVRITESDGDRDGSIIEENRPVTRQVLSPQTAEIMNDVFRGVVTSRGGTGQRAASVKNAHGKTGTTSDDRDAWFVGYTPELSCAVWVGNDDFRKKMNAVWGGNVCAPAWTEFMQKALRLYREEDHNNSPQLKEPGGSDSRERTRRESREKSTEPGGQRTVTICSESGLLSNSSCPNTYEATYDSGSEPNTRCNIHRNNGKAEEGRAEEETRVPPASGKSEYISATICTESGLIANDWCSETITKRFRADEAPKRICNTHRAP
jgi:penicillin-binding protein 1A